MWSFVTMSIKLLQSSEWEVKRQSERDIQRVIWRARWGSPLLIISPAASLSGLFCSVLLLWGIWSLSRTAEAGVLDVESAALYFRSFSGVSVFVSVRMCVYVGFFVVIWPRQVSYQLSAALSAPFDLFCCEGSPLLSSLCPRTPRGHLLEDFSLNFLHPLKCTSRHVHSATVSELLSERKFRQEGKSAKARKRNGTSVHYSIHFTKRNS